jgi:hypothetical protein
LAETSNAISAQQASMHKPKRLSAALLDWSRAKFRGSAKLVQEKYKQLAVLQCEETPGDRESILRIQSEIEQLLEMEDMKWKQRAKRNWFSQGDRNTQFFHAWANFRRKKNRIGSIVDTEGTLWSKPEEVGGAFVPLFSVSLYLSKPKWNCRESGWG